MIRQLAPILCVSLICGVAGSDEPARPAHAKSATESYPGFKADQALLRKHLLHKDRDSGKEIKASSAEACDAAKRVFSRVSFLFRTRDEVLSLLGDPATISDYNKPAAEDARSPLVYVFDTGFGGLKYTIHFGQLDRLRATQVTVEGQD